MNPSEELRRHATACGQMATFLRTKENRAAWNDIAERYLRFAQWYDTRPLSIGRSWSHSVSNRRFIPASVSPAFLAWAIPMAVTFFSSSGLIFARMWSCSASGSSCGFFSDVVVKPFHFYLKRSPKSNDAQSHLAWAPLYDPADLDEWAKKRLGPKRRSTSESYKSRTSVAGRKKLNKIK
jgi:hypothetical protein